MDDDFNIGENEWLAAVEANPDPYEFMGDLRGQFDVRDTQLGPNANRGILGQTFGGSNSTSLSTAGSSGKRDFTFGQSVVSTIYPRALTRACL